MSSKYIILNIRDRRENARISVTNFKDISQLRQLIRSEFNVIGPFDLFAGIHFIPRTGGIDIFEDKEIVSVIPSKRNITLDDSFETISHGDSLYEDHNAEISKEDKGAADAVIDKNGANAEKIYPVFQFYKYPVYNGNTKEQMYEYFYTLFEDETALKDYNDIRAYFGEAIPPHIMSWFFGVPVEKVKHNFIAGNSTAKKAFLTDKGPNCFLNFGAYRPQLQRAIAKYNYNNDEVYLPHMSFQNYNNIVHIVSTTQELNGSIFDESIASVDDWADSEYEYYHTRPFRKFPFIAIYNQTDKNDYEKIKNYFGDLNNVPGHILDWFFGISKADFKLAVNKGIKHAIELTSEEQIGFDNDDSTNTTVATPRPSLKRKIMRIMESGEEKFLPYMSFQNAKSIVHDWVRGEIETDVSDDE